MLEAINRFDLLILTAVRGAENPVLDVLMKCISVVGNKGMVFILFSAVLLFSAKTRRGGVYAAASLALDAVVCNLILKPLIARPRPFDFFAEISREALIISPPTDYSFPSGHTAAAFAFSTALFCRDKRWGTVSYIFSAAMGYSRIYLAVHYPTDVVFGAVLGTVCGIAAVHICDAVYKYRADKLTNKR